MALVAYEALARTIQVMAGVTGVSLIFVDFFLSQVQEIMVFFHVVDILIDHFYEILLHRQLLFDQQLLLHGVNLAALAALVQLDVLGFEILALILAV